MKARCAALACLVLGCTEPSYVSLGRNVQPVVDTSETEPCAPENSPDDQLLSGCEPPAAPPVCELGAQLQALTSACAERRVVECSSVSSLDYERLSAVLTDLLGDCSIQGHRLQVLFSAGCASAFSLESSDVPGAEATAACVAARLEGEQYPCAQSLDCGVGLWLGTPTSSVEPDWY